MFIRALTMAGLMLFVNPTECISCGESQDIDRVGVEVSPSITELESFLHAIALFESEGKHHVVSEYGMMGKYQFSRNTISHLGYNVTELEFLSNPILQDSIMVSYMRQNYEILKPYIRKYSGQEINGVLITTSGVLAGAHFAGPGGVIKFFNTPDSIGTVDKNGMSLKVYMNKFKHFQFNEIRL